MRCFENFLSLARDTDAGYILDTVAAELRDPSGNAKPVVLNAVIGPRGDAYRPERTGTLKAFRVNW
jgi:hypothetical protein